MESFKSYCDKRKLKADSGFIQRHKDFYGIFKLYLKELAYCWFFKRLK